jgi:HD domain protein
MLLGYANKGIIKKLIKDIIMTIFKVTIKNLNFTKSLWALIFDRLIVPQGVKKVKTYNIAEVKEHSYFSSDLFLDDKFLLLIPELQVSETLKNLLAKWDFSTVCSEGENINVPETGNLESAAGTVAKTAEKEKLSESTKRQNELLDKVETKYKEFLGAVFEFHETAKQGLNLNIRAVSDLAKDLVEFIEERNKQILLIDTQQFADEYDYVILHEIGSTVFAVVIGRYLKLPTYKLIELATACLIHEIGMARVPPRVYNSTKPLTVQEKQVLLAHPILSYNIVNASSFALPICLACLEHHERDNGGGYPRRLSANRLSLYGKIIAVACSYEAITNPRPYRYAKSPTTAIMELVKNENKQYDDNVLKALLYSVSFFPIGTYVILSDGRYAQVVDVNPDDPRFPIVQILGEMSSGGNLKVVGTDKDTLYIARTVNKTDIDPALLKRN